MPLSTAVEGIWAILWPEITALQWAAADRTLRGLCDWVEAEAPEPVDLAIEGAASLKAAVVPLILHYSLVDALA